MIRLLAKSQEAKGRLFEQFIQVLLTNMGYRDIELRVSRNGSEVDFEATDELSGIPVMGECKAYSKAVDGPKVQKFIGNFGPRWSKDNRIVGIFFSLSQLNSKADEWWRFLEGTPMGKNVKLHQGKDILDILYRNQLCVTPEVVRTRVHDYVDLQLGVTYLAFFKSKLVWIQTLLDDQGKPSAFTALDSEGNPLYQSVLDGIKIVDPEVKNLSPIDITKAMQKTLDLDEVPPYLIRVKEHCGKETEIFVHLKAEVGQTPTVFQRSQFSRVSSKPIDENQTYSNIATRALDEMMDEIDKLLILAEPGGGKTHAIHHYAAKLAERWLEGNRGGQIPVLIDLSRYRGETLLEILRGAFADFEFYAQTASLEHLLKTGGMAILIDGFNEVEAKQLPYLRKELTNLLRRYPKNKVILTSRKEGYKEALPLTICTIKDLDSQGMVEMLQAYLKKAGGDPNTARSIILSLDVTIRDLCSNPLILSLVAMLMIRDKAIPRLRASLFEDFTNYFLGEWERKISEIELTIRKQILSKIAHKMNEMETAAIGFDTLKKESSTELRTIKQTEGISVSFLDVFNELLLSGMIVRTGDEFKFKHQSFQDFFAARYMMFHGVDLGFLGREWWTNTYIFLAGLLDRPDEIVTTGLQKIGIFFAGACITHGNAVQEETLCEVKRIAQNLVRDERRSSVTRSMVARLIGSIGDATDFAFLFDIFKRTRSDSLRYDLLRAMNRCEGKIYIPTEDFLTEIIKESEDRVVLFQGVNVLIHKLQDWENVLLKAISRSDLTPETRIEIWERLVHRRSERSLDLIISSLNDKSANDTLKAEALEVLSEFARPVYNKANDTDIQEWVFRHEGITDVCIELLCDVNQSDIIRRLAVYAVPSVYNRAKSYFLQLLIDPTTPLKVSRAIVRRLCEEILFGLAHDPIVLSILENKECETELRATVAEDAHPSYSIDSDIYDRLTQARFNILVDPEEKISLRAKAAIGLGWDGQYRLEHGIPKHAGIDEALLKELGRAEGVSFRRAIIEALVRRKVEAVVQILKDTVGDEAEEVKWRERCCVYLYWLGTDKAANTLLTYATNKTLKTNVRAECISCLGYVAKEDKGISRERSFRDQCVDTLTGILRESGNSGRIKEATLEALANLMKADQLILFEGALEDMEA